MTWKILRSKPFHLSIWSRSGPQMVHIFRPPKKFTKKFGHDFRPETAQNPKNTVLDTTACEKNGRIKGPSTFTDCVPTIDRQTGDYHGPVVQRNALSSIDRFKTVGFSQIFGRKSRHFSVKNRCPRLPVLAYERFFSQNCKRSGGSQSKRRPLSMGFKTCGKVCR